MSGFTVFNIQFSVFHEKKQQLWKSDLTGISKYVT